MLSGVRVRSRLRSSWNCADLNINAGPSSLCSTKQLAHHRWINEANSTVVFKLYLPAAIRLVEAQMAPYPIVNRDLEFLKVTRA